MRFAVFDLLAVIRFEDILRKDAPNDSNSMFAIRHSHRNCERRELQVPQTLSYSTKSRLRTMKMRVGFVDFAGTEKGFHRQ